MLFYVVLCSASCRDEQQNGTQKTPEPIDSQGLRGFRFVLYHKAIIFFVLSSKESRAPARGRAGNGALRPKAASELPIRRARSTGLPLAGGRVGTGVGPSGNGRPEPVEEMPKAASPLGRPPWAMRCYFVVCFLPISKCSLTIYGNQYP